MTSYFQTALMFGNAVQHAIDTKLVQLERTNCNRNNGQKLAQMFGWKVLGAGHFSSVYANPFDTNTVFKVNISKQGAVPDAWIDYASWCMRHENEDPHYLRVYEIAVFPDCFVSIMERLEESSTVQRTIVRHVLDLDDGPIPAELSTQVEKFREAYLRVSEFVGIDDLHLGNVMHRDGQLVITDPLYFRSKRSRYEDYLNGHRIERERTVLAASSEVLTARPA